MFQDDEKMRSSRYENSRSAAAVTSSLDELIGLRIALQRPLDIAQHFPISTIDVSSEASSTILDFTAERQNASKILQQILKDILSMKSFSPTKEDGKRVGQEAVIGWDTVISAQIALEKKSKWADVLNLWHARMNFGSEHVKSKLKVFNRNLWDQIEDILTDEARVIEKSRFPHSESQRVDKNSSLIDGGHTDNDNDNGSSSGGGDSKEEGYEEEDMELRDKGKQSKAFDLEVYDDRNFYSLLLKSFIMNSSVSSSVGESSMRAADLQALKNFKKRKAENVERKASKGRKIRYKVHAKLQHFMFPVPAVPPAGLDVDRLMASLFQ